MPRDTSQSKIAQIIFKNRHPALARKDSARNSVWKLIYDSYLGGIDFKDGDYLIRYPKESKKSFDTRKSRSVYFNQVSPIVDMLSGMLFLNDPKREIPSSLSFFTEKTSSDKGLNEFMRILAAHSLMFTCGVLIDMPDYDPEIVKTERDIRDYKIQPYAVLYLPFRIRDFYLDRNGNLEWVLLDNTYWDHSDPFSDGKYVKEYRLWTKDYYRDFTYNLGDKEVRDSGEIPHSVGIVPFRFVSWRDDNNDFIGETIFEDIAMISKLIYNSMSYMDEMLASGTFKMLAYPTKTGALPDELTSGGVGPLSVMPYDGTLSQKPEFIGAELGQIDPFIKAMGFYMAEILKKVGLDTDETKEFVKSGAAKKIDFQKMRALLESGAFMMERAEMWMYEVASRWMGGSETITSEYTSDFSSEELEKEVSMLTQLLIHPYQKLRESIMQVLVKKLLSNSLPPEDIEKINAEITASTVVDKNLNKTFDSTSVSMNL